MTRRQNAMMDRKYRKVVIRPDTEYLDKLNKALNLAHKFNISHPVDKALAIHLTNGRKLKPKRLSYE